METKATNENHMIADDNASARWVDALLAIKILAYSLHSEAMAPLSICVKASAGPSLDAWIASLEEILGQKGLLPIPPHIDLDRLVGGIDLSATLSTGRKIEKPGLLAQADGKAVLLRFQESMDAEIVSSIANAVDQSEILVERDGVSARHMSRFALVVVHDVDDAVPAAIADRIAIHINLEGIDIRQIGSGCEIPLERSNVSLSFSPDPETVKSIVEMSVAFGILSLRPPQQALGVGLAHAELQSRRQLNQDDVITALRLSLLPRAVCFPSDDDDSIEAEESPQDNLSEDKDHQQNEGEDKIGELEDLSIESMLANLPDGLLDVLKDEKKSTVRSSVIGRTGNSNTNFKRGRPVSSVRGKPSSNKRMDILATLRASAPWQKMRKVNASEERADRLQIRSDDFHIRRFKKPAESTTIFLVDASGSTAINRLGEAKGAVELVLSQSYARRDHVAMIAMKGPEAEIILPTTRSLVLAKRTLSGLTGGGGTPLADGLRKALSLASEEQRKGRVPSLIVLTDGSANVDLNGQPGREKAQLDALEMARHVALSNYATLVIDVSKLVGKQAKEMANACNSQYVAMPFANASLISNEISNLQSVSPGS